MGEHRFLSVFLYSAAVTFHFRFCFINSSFLPVSKVTSMSTPRMAVFMAKTIPYTSLLSGHSTHLVCLLSHHYTFSLVKQTNKQKKQICLASHVIPPDPVLQGPNHGNQVDTCIEIAVILFCALKSPTSYTFIPC